MVESGSSHSRSEFIFYISKLVFFCSFSGDVEYVGIKPLLSLLHSPLASSGVSDSCLWEPL